MGFRALGFRGLGVADLGPEGLRVSISDSGFGMVESSGIGFRIIGYRTPSGVVQVFFGISSVLQPDLSRGI